MFARNDGKPINPSYATTGFWKLTDGCLTSDAVHGFVFPVLDGRSLTVTVQ